MAARFERNIVTTVVPGLSKEFSYKNVMAVPKIEKITINIGMGEATQNAKLMDGAVERADADRGPEAGDHEGDEIDCAVQASRGPVDWMLRDLAGRPDVRIF